MPSTQQPPHHGRERRTRSRRQAGSILVGGSWLSTKQTETYDSLTRRKVPKLRTIKLLTVKVHEIVPLEPELRPVFP